MVLIVCTVHTTNAFVIQSLKFRVTLQNAIISNLFIVFRKNFLRNKTSIHSVVCVHSTVSDQINLISFGCCSNKFSIKFQQKHPIPSEELKNQVKIFCMR